MTHHWPGDDHPDEPVFEFELGPDEVQEWVKERGWELYIIRLLRAEETHDEALRGPFNPEPLAHNAVSDASIYLQAFCEWQWADEEEE